MSESAVEIALRPISRDVVSSRRKWTPSTIASTEVAVVDPGRVTAASSPLPSLTRGSFGGSRFRSLASNSNSPIPPTIPNTKVRRDVERRQPFLHRVGEVGSQFGKKPPRSRKLRLALQAGLALLIFGFLVLTVIDQWSEIQSEGVHFHIGWLIPAILVLPGYFVLSALGWDLILRALGYRIGFGRAQVAWGQPLLARYVPGSVLYVLGRVLLSERAGVPRRITIASVVYEQAISATSAIVIAAYFIINHPDLQGQ